MAFNGFLVIEGNIGAGKTTLVNKLAEKYGAGKILEQFEDNPFLPKFYADQSRYAFPLELAFMADRYKQLKEKLMSPALFEPFKVSDYYFMKSLIFAGITLKEDEYKLYRQLFDIIYQTLPKPDLYVYLHLPVDQLVNNIHSRNRDYEKHISKDYLDELKKAYWEFFKQCDFPVLVLNTRLVDFVKDEKDFETINDLIFNHTYPPGISIINVEPSKI